ncbi:hypothetical protein ACFW6R_08955 [Streptomyces albidoflavus]
MDDAMKAMQDTINRMFSALAETIRDLMPLPEHPTGLAAETECPGPGGPHTSLDLDGIACPHCGADV